jgi:NADH:ubiquinone oxidoreductase subunit E
MTERYSLQHSALSCQLLMNSASFVAEDILPETSSPCRIVCDETAEDFRLTLCRTLCTGACPRAQDLIRENPCKSVAVFLKAEN